MFNGPHDLPTANLSGARGYPTPAATINLRDAITFRAVDDDGQPLIVISDGVHSVALGSGPSGLSFGLVIAAQHLADAFDDYAKSATAGWEAVADTKPQRSPDRPAGPSSGRHRRNRPTVVPPRPERGNIRRG
jgi:hypothetical protein